MALSEKHDGADADKIDPPNVSRQPYRSTAPYFWLSLRLVIYMRIWADIVWRSDFGKGERTMTIESAVAFAVGMFLLALVPGPGLATIISRTIGSGLKAGFAVTAGLCIGDFIFLGLAMIGLSTIANAFGPAFQVVKYIGAAYLIWIGFRMFGAARKPIEVNPVSISHPLKETALGLFVTLGNPKPILFYSALLPTFLDMTKVGLADYFVLSATVVIVSCVVYGGYMLLADRSRRFLASTTAAKRLNQITGITLVGAGVAVATR